MRRRQVEALEADRRRIIIERRHLVDALPEPQDGCIIQIKYPDGNLRRRTFLITEPFQDLVAFAGCEDSASQVFLLQSGLSCQQLQSTLTGSILDQGIQGSCTLYVLWFSSEEVEAVLSTRMPTSHTSETGALSPFTMQSLSRSQALSPSLPRSPFLARSPSPPRSLSPSRSTSLPTYPSLPMSPSRSIVYVPSSPTESLDLLEEVEVSHLQQLVSQCDFESSPTANMINVCRSDVMNCALRAFGRGRFDTKKKISVIFMDDDGGPLREFLRLLLTDIRRCAIFQGPDNQKKLSLDVNALHTGLYSIVGKMISVCLIHGGVAPHFFSERLYNRISGKATGPASLADVGDQHVHERLKEIKNAEMIVQAREAILQASEILAVLGTMRHISSMDERDSLINHSIFQFMEGLSTSKHIQKSSKPFVENTQKTSAEDLINLFQPVLSIVGSSRRREESRVLCYWRDWLIDIEGHFGEVHLLNKCKSRSVFTYGGECAELQLEDILIFASGLSRIPPLGFPVQPSLEF